MNPEGDLCNKVLTMSLLAPGVFSSDDGQLFFISIVRCWAASRQEAAAACAVLANAIVIVNAMAARAIVDERNMTVACPGLSQEQLKAFIFARQPIELAPVYRDSLERIGATGRFASPGANTKC
jgi:hypothetical protein